jgi:peroxiredoxin
MKTILRILVSAIAFVVASGATYVVIKKRNAPKPVNTVKRQQRDTIEGASGPTEGATVTLPTLTTPKGEKVNLANLKEERVLCVFVTSQCSGCVRDLDLWKDLHRESSKRGTAFYLIDISDDSAEVERFSSAYQLQDMPLLYDPEQKIGARLKIGFVPQYVLFTRAGQVVHRWDGVQPYEKQGDASQLAEYFDAH